MPLPLNPMADLPQMQEMMTNPNPMRTRIAPVRSTMIQSTRLRDPRLAQKEPQKSSQSHPPIQIIASNPTKSLPRIPKLSQSSSKSSRDSNKDRDSRDRKEDLKSSSSSKSSRSSSRDKSKSSSSSSSRSSERSKSKSSDKKHDDDRKSSHKSSSSSSHRSSRSSRSKSPSRSSSEAKETQRPDSTTGVNKDKLLTELLNGEEHKSSQLTISSSENGKQTKSILVDKVCDKVKSDLKWDMTCDFKLNIQFLILRIYNSI
jgi:hypothetical protein